MFLSVFYKKGFKTELEVVILCFENCEKMHHIFPFTKTIMTKIRESHKKRLLLLLRSKEISDVRQGLELLDTIIEDVKDIYYVFDMTDETLSIRELDQLYLEEYTHRNPIRMALIDWFLRYKPKWIMHTSSIELCEGKLDDLTNEEFDSFLKNIQQLTCLRILHLFNNSITTLPDSIGKLTNLMALTIGQNKLTSLPESIGELTTLQYLHLNDNQLASLPNSFCNLKGLEELTLNHNQLKIFPEVIKMLTKIHTLEISDNPFNT